MDNVTHSLIGLSLAGSLGRKGARPVESHALAWTAVLGSNLPDLDSFGPAIRGAGKLGYLLEHRGYTHTFPVAFLLGVLAAGMGYLAYVRQRPEDAPAFPWRHFLAIGVVSAFLHIGADFWNEYGIHPFWPFSNRWFFGDVLMIVEPLLWFAVLPWAILSTRRGWARAIWGVASAAILGVSWVGPFMPRTVAAALTAWLLAWTGAHLGLRGKGARAGALASVAGILAVVGGFGAASARVHARAQEIVARSDPRARVLQLVASPAPSNPLCWRVIPVTLDERGEYRARLGALSLAPALFDPAHCYPGLRVERTAPLAPVSGLGRDPDAYWEGEFVGDWRAFESLRRSDCRFRDFLRFARVPFWVTGSAGSAGVAGDLRFDREKGLGFAEFQLGEAGGGCLGSVPPWDSPILGNIN